MATAAQRWMAERATGELDIECSSSSDAMLLEYSAGSTTQASS
jgi:hypothetical protein